MTFRPRQPTDCGRPSTNSTVSSRPSATPSSHSRIRATPRRMILSGANGDAIFRSPVSRPKPSCPAVTAVFPSGRRWRMQIRSPRRRARDLTRAIGRGRAGAGGRAGSEPTGPATRENIQEEPRRRSAGGGRLPSRFGLTEGKCMFSLTKKRLMGAAVAAMLVAGVGVAAYADTATPSSNATAVGHGIDEFGMTAPTTSIRCSTSRTRRGSSATRPSRRARRADARSADSTTRPRPGLRSALHHRAARVHRPDEHAAVPVHARVRRSPRHRRPHASRAGVEGLVPAADRRAAHRGAEELRGSRTRPLHHRHQQLPARVVGRAGRRCDERRDVRGDPAARVVRLHPAAHRQKDPTSSVRSRRTCSCSSASMPPATATATARVTTTGEVTTTGRPPRRARGRANAVRPHAPSIRGRATSVHGGAARSRELGPGTACRSTVSDGDGGRDDGLHRTHDERRRSRVHLVG